MAAKSIYTAACASDIPHDQLQNRGGAYDLRAEGMVRPSHGIDYGGDLFHVAVFAHGGKEISGLQNLIARNTGNALHHFGGVARIVLAKKLIDAARVLERQIKIDFLRHR